MTTTKSFCRVCIAGCGTIVTTDGDQVTDVRGDPDHPLSKGYLCPKGRALGALHHDPARISGAFIGRRADDRRAVSTDAAVVDAADALAKVIETHGPGSVGCFLGSGGFIDPAGVLALRGLRRRLGTSHNYSTATVDSIAKVVTTALVAGTTALVPHLDDDADLVLLMGSNPVISHGQSTAFPDPLGRLRAITARGGELVVIDPRRTESAAHAGRHLSIGANTDHVLLAHLVRDVIARRGIDEGRLPQAADGFASLAAAVAPYDLDRTAELTGLPAEEITALAESIDEAGRVAVITGTGCTMSPMGNLVEWFSWALMILTDSFDKPGGLWFNPGYLTRLDTRDVLPAARDLGGPESHPTMLNVSGEWPASVVPAEIEAGRLKALVVVGCNLVTALPDPVRLEAALDQLDVLIVFDLFDNETGAHATHLFATPDQLERPDLVPLDMYVPAMAGQYTPRVIDPAGDREPVWRTLARIGTRLGMDLVGGDPDTMTTDDVLARVARGADLEVMRQASTSVVGERAVYDWAVSRLPDGCWHLAPEPLLGQLAAWESSLGSPTEGLVLTPRRQLRRENARAYRAGEVMHAWVHPDDATAHGVLDGQMVELRADTGTITLEAEVTERVRPGAVAVPHGWADTNVNRLISTTALDPLSGMPFMSGTPVTMRPVAADSSS